VNKLKIDNIDDLVEEHNRLLNGNIPTMGEESRQLDNKFIKAVKLVNGNLTVEEFNERSRQWTKK